MYDNGVGRASFMLNKEKPMLDATTPNWDAEPFEVIQKERKKDLNIIKGQQRNIFDTDVRITVNFENKRKYEEVKNMAFKQENIRFKKRTSFQIGWMRIDATEVQTGPQIEYECELEITDINFLLKHYMDKMSFRSCIRKYLLN